MRNKSGFPVPETTMASKRSSVLRAGRKQFVIVRETVDSLKSLNYER